MWVDVWGCGGQGVGSSVGGLDLRVLDSVLGV